MKKITTTRKANRRSTQERKHLDGVQNQLSKRRSSSASSERAKNPNMNTSLEQNINEEKAVAVTEAPKTQQVEFTRGQLGKAKRAFAKANQPDASEEVRKKWLAEMKEANVPVMDSSSSRLAKVIKREITVADLR
jgi:hypothetical protein